MGRIKDVRRGRENAVKDCFVVMLEVKEEVRRRRREVVNINK
jgi:hypothetical protein